MSELRGLPRIGPSVLVPSTSSRVPACHGFAILAYSLLTLRWHLYNHGAIFSDLPAAQVAADAMPRTYVHVHVLALDLDGGAVEIRP